MRTADPRRVGVTSRSILSSDAVFLGFCSLATQAVYLKSIISSPSGGELYAALALGGWLGWVGLGSFAGRRMSRSFRSQAWLCSSIIKLPIAVLIFMYPGFFLEALDPMRFLPLALGGMALPGVLYGILFASLLTPETRASAIYRNEAIGSFIGGMVVTIWALIDLGDFGLLALISITELSRIWGRRALSTAAIAFGLILGITIYPQLDRLSMKLRWPGFETLSIAHGFSGSWSVISRKNQLTILHGGSQIGSIPDRAGAEEALLWPLLFKPECHQMLLIGYEGVPVSGILPDGVRALCLVGDGAYLRLGIDSLSSYRVADPLSFQVPRKFDIVSIRLRGAENLYDYRLETDFLFRRCRAFLNDGGILFVSTASDENYVSPYLAEYLSSLRKTLAGLYAIIEVVPGVRAGFICRKDSSAPGITSDPIAAFHRSGINSPYFNAALIANRLMPFKTTSFATSINPRANSNDIYKPSSVLHFLKWQGSQFGAKGWVFSLYESPYVFAVFVLLALIPLLETALTRQRFISGFGVSNFGFIGMALEIVGLYLFQMLFGTLYLHIGLMMGVFMVGLAAGAGLAQKLNRWAPFLGASLASLVLLLMPAFTTGEMSLPVAGIVLYILILVAGFTTGGGFAFFANRLSNDSGSGAGLYGADLFGALQAAIFVPGLIMSLGTIGLAIALIVISLVNLVTLRFGNSINLSSV